MESDEQVSKKDVIKVEIPSDHQTDQVVCAGLMRQQSMTKNNCLCSPTTHEGSFRCRLHRTPSLQRTKSLSYTSPEPKTQRLRLACNATYLCSSQ